MKPARSAALINYEYIKNEKNKECNNAIKRVFEKININEINNFINSILCISNIRKMFYKKIINYRYEIIRDVYFKLNKK